MAKFDLKFLDTDKETCFIQAKIFDNKEIEIGIIDEGFVRAYIYLDKSTAIKFAKTLRTEINKITESEKGGLNG